ncbi:carbohydrate ABC transporter permease [Sansalvadorimonas sp. 2012CJ34-2]|uniref:Carbohydrate ABC transporter permease n=1 Tax=Parendozoicomonas callyspongiae TaxID=2942213 RepID=A0ABT0PEK6_9GAMM|nr:carbohydrate ABC transporter permease [Sansalvadorimonas sp. 2012CJ34-2]MCL6269641.1 carbohydrate ABC transporter permease [Sansalvadorimonas sp. 2012CJ34-2]
MLNDKKFSLYSLILMALMSVMMLLPLWNVIATAFSTNLDSMKPGLLLWPETFSVEGFEVLFNRLEFWRPFANTMFVTVIGVFLHVFLASVGGYVMAQPNLPGKHFLTGIILLTLTIPSQIIMVPLFIVFKDFHLLNTLTSLIVAELVSGFSILLMRNYFEQIPHSLLEAARIDGASNLTIFFKVYLPLTIPGLITVGLFDVVRKYNMFVKPLIFINDPEKITLQIALKSIVMLDNSTSSSDIVTNNVVAGAIVVALVPLVLFYPYIQKFFIKGAHAGAEKG